MTAATLNFLGKILCCPPIVNSPKGKPHFVIRWPALTQTPYRTFCSKKNTAFHRLSSPVKLGYHFSLVFSNRNNSFTRVMPLHKMANLCPGSAESLQRITLSLVRLVFYHASFPFFEFLTTKKEVSAICFYFLLVISYLIFYFDKLGFMKLNLSTALVPPISAHQHQSSSAYTLSDTALPP